VKITAITIQAKDKNRVNVSVDGNYRFSLDVFQVGELGLKVGKDYSEEELVGLEQESQFGKLYARALEYCLMRPHSSREVKDYLWRKTRTTKVKARNSNELKERPGVSPVIADRVFDRLVEKGYIDDEKFARYWLENRSLTKGASKRKLVAELRAKGVDQTTIEVALETTSRSDESELRKVIAKKHARYQDEKKLMAYLAGQGFGYDDIKQALSEIDD
jgi:regulatory protein